jgi:hypothetical protein
MGNTAMMADNGNCRSLGLAAAGGVKTGCGLDCGLGCGGVAGGEVRAGVAVATGRGGATAVAPLSSKRRSRPRNNPANFDFTMFDMAGYPITQVLSNKQDDLIKQKPCQLTMSCWIAAAVPVMSQLRASGCIKLDIPRFCFRWHVAQFLKYLLTKFVELPPIHT